MPYSLRPPSFSRASNTVHRVTEHGGRWAQDSPPARRPPPRPSCRWMPRAERLDPAANRRSVAKRCSARYSPAFPRNDPHAGGILAQNLHRQTRAQMPPMMFCSGSFAPPQHIAGVDHADEVGGRRSRSGRPRCRARRGRRSSGCSRPAPACDPAAASCPRNSPRSRSMAADRPEYRAVSSLTVPSSDFRFLPRCGGPCAGLLLVGLKYQIPTIGSITF